MIFRTILRGEEEETETSETRGARREKGRNECRQRIQKEKVVFS